MGTSVGATVAVISGTNTISVPIVLDGSLAVSTSSGGLLDLSGSLSQAAGVSAGLSLGGNGKLILSGTDSYSGSTAINGGTLYVIDTAALPAGTSLTVAAGGAIILDSSAAAEAVVAAASPALSAVPEPATWVLLLACLWSAVIYHRFFAAKRLFVQKVVETSVEVGRNNAPPPRGDDRCSSGGNDQMFNQLTNAAGTSLRLFRPTISGDKSPHSKMRFRVILGIVVATAAAGFALFHGPREAPSQVHDGLRIVSLAPSVTEILFALDLGDQVIGVTDRCDYPPAAQAIERISGFGTPNVEKLLAVAPDLVVACGLEKPDVMKTLRQAGIRVVDMQEKGYVASFSDLFAAIRRIGEATGRSANAERLVAQIEARLAAVAARVRPIDGTRRVRVFVEIEESPLMTAGAGSFLNDLIRRAGGRNVAGDLRDAYPRIDPEQVVAWNPEVILAAHCDRKGEAADRMARRIGWSNIEAVRQRRVVDDIDADLLFRPGPRLVEGVEMLAARLYPK